MKDVSKYPFELRTHTLDEGGGYLVSFPDFNESIADGETIEEAISEGQQALAAVIATLEAKGLPVPAPGSYGAYSASSYSASLKACKPACKAPLKTISLRSPLKVV